MADMMRQMGAMKITTQADLDQRPMPIGDDLFKVPEGYTDRQVA